MSVTVTRPDLPRGKNLVTISVFPDAARAAAFADGGGAFVSGTGGAAKVVGSAVVLSTFSGDDAVVAAATSCVNG